MSTEYFILTGPELGEHDADRSQVVTLSRDSVTYILPKSNLNYYCSHGLFENRLIEWSRQFCSRDKIFLDIGAHTGTYAISLAGSCKSVHAFEPQRSTYYALCGGIALSGYCNRIVAHNYGLGNQSQEGENTLNIVSADGGGSSMHVTDETQILHKEKIQVKTLDSVLSESDSAEVGFIKMDVEDNEVFVLQGATMTLIRSNWPTILFESNRDNAAPFDCLRNMGYSIVPISGISNMFLASHNR